MKLILAQSIKQFDTMKKGPVDSSAMHPSLNSAITSEFHMLSPELQTVVKKFASAHYQSNLAYDLLNGVCAKLPILESTGQWTEHRISPFTSSTSAFSGFMLVPTTVEVKEIKIIFQGTVLSADRKGLGNLNANLEPVAAAAKFWRAEGQNIFDQFKEMVANENLDYEDLTISVTGHSRGAALAQYFATEIFEGIDTGEINVVPQVDVTIFNNTGVDEFTLEKFDQVFHHVKEKYDYNCQLTGKIGHTHGDPIQQTGRGTIFDHLTPEDAQLEMVKIDKSLFKYWSKDIDFSTGLHISDVFYAIFNAAKSAFLAHKNDGYFGPDNAYGEIDIKYPFSYFTNQTPEHVGIIQNELTYKSLFIQKIFEPGKFLIHNLLYLISDVGAHEMAHETFSPAAPQTSALTYSDIFSKEEEIPFFESTPPLPTMLATGYLDSLDITHEVSKILEHF